MLGQPHAARQWYERAIALRREPLHDDVGVAEGMIDLAVLESDAAHAGAAIDRLRATQHQLRARLADRHPLMVEIQRSLGALYLDRGQAAEAERALRSGLALSMELHGPGHPSTLAVRRQLGQAYLQLGRLAEAEQALQAQHGPTEALLGPRHRETALSLDALGRLALERGDADAAAAYFQRAVQIWRQPDGRHLLEYGLIDLALAQRAHGEAALARATLEEARKVRVARLGASHPAVGDLDRRMGEMLLDAGEIDAALTWLQRGSELTGVGYGPDDPRTRQAQLALARWQAARGDGGVALERFAAALPGDDPTLVPLAWEARAYAAQAHCSAGDTGLGSGRLRALDAELRSARPEGGRLARAVVALAGACDARLNAAARSTAAR